MYVQSGYDCVLGSLLANDVRYATLREVRSRLTGGVDGSHDLTPTDLLVTAQYAAFQSRLALLPLRPKLARDPWIRRKVAPRRVHRAAEELKAIVTAKGPGTETLLASLEPDEGSILVQPGRELIAGVVRAPARYWTLRAAQLLMLDDAITAATTQGNETIAPGYAGEAELRAASESLDLSHSGRARPRRCFTDAGAHLDNAYAEVSAAGFEIPYRRV